MKEMQENGFEFAKEIFKINEYASVAKDGIIAGDFNGFLDSGSYTLNALLSGSIYGGFPYSKVTALAGPSGVGKTFFALTTMKLFLDSDPRSLIILFESESALSKKLLTDFGIDVNRVLVLPVETVERFRHQCLSLLIKYGSQSDEEKRPMLIVLDSLGMLSTEKEMNDIAEGKDTKDMTRAQVVKGAFRVLTLRLGKLGIPMILTNHSYSEMGMYPKTVMGGGTGLQYAASTVVFLAKKKDKLGNDFVGNIIHCKLDKGRLTKEGSLVDTSINFKTGLQRWHGMDDLALEVGIWKKTGTRIELPDGSKLFASVIMKEPEKFFTDDVMAAIDYHCKNKFLYGNAIKEDMEEIDGESSSNGDDNYQGAGIDAGESEI